MGVGMCQWLEKNNIGVTRVFLELVIWRSIFSYVA